MKKKIIAFFVCLLFIAIGFGWGIYEYSSKNGLSIQDVINVVSAYFKTKPEPKPTAKPEETVVKTVESKPKPPIEIKPTVIPNGIPYGITPPKLAMTLEAAQELLSQAETAYKKMDFDGAMNTAKKVISANPSPIITRQASDLNRKCTVFKSTVKDIKKEEVRQGMVEIQYSNGQSSLAQLLGETKTSVKVNENGIEKEIPLSNLSRYTKLTNDDYLAKMRGDYQKKLSRLTNPTAKDYHQLAINCYKKQLNPETLAMLELTWEKDEKYLVSVSGATLDTTEQPITTSTINKNPPPVLNETEFAKRLKEAEALYEQGKEHMEKTYDKGPDFDSENKKARDTFRASLNIYTQLREMNPDDKDIEAKITDIEYYLVCIRKQSR
jgi:hypothetical protein